MPFPHGHALLIGVAGECGTAAGGARRDVDPTVPAVGAAGVLRDCGG
jgi:hypothetical protein